MTMSFTYPSLIKYTGTSKNDPLKKAAHLMDTVDGSSLNLPWRKQMKTEKPVKPTYGNIRIGNIIVKFETTDPISPTNPAILTALNNISTLWEANKDIPKP